MTVKEARTNLRAAIAIFRKRIRFPRIRIREIMESEDLVTATKEFMFGRVQKFLEKSK
jgi:hypothetical protein